MFYATESELAVHLCGRPIAWVAGGRNSLCQENAFPSSQGTFCVNEMVRPRRYDVGLS
jgi:hypothetical protein